ncbi:signal peptide peptidase SppA [Bacteriovorax sp. Seq25_V]|uniref:signal peptide peptidase SppA n=1 Tax=Bacteriovorax sp. Seq25_V TaxID=1201288 RepID=UPI00038A44F4|nr:signal peptide peptidase SppA [Bacteriovorax sp. Seq25_V]EQC45340.1 signal peptide peptidase SppA, 36K type [Bacteriovorax sp. Seq25_V]
MAAQKQKSKAVIGLMSLVAVFFVVLVIFSVYTVKVFKNVDGNGDGFNLSSKGSDSIGVIEVNGVIFDSKDLVELIHKAEEDKTVKAIVMRVNSPGGAVAPTQEVYDEIRRIDDSYTKSEGKEGKPIYASFSSVAASGGYYLGAATRRICALPGTITGSIGVIMQFMDLSKLYEFAKLNPQTIKAGKYKDVGQPNRALTEEEYKLMTTMTAGVHKQFIRDIEKTRKDKIKGNIEDHAQGQVFSGEDAFNLGLVDELSGLWSCARNIHKELKLKGELNLNYIKKKKKFNFLDMVGDLEEASTYVKEMVKNSNTPLMMYK